MRGILNRHPAALVSCLFLAIVSALVVMLRRQTGGMFVYPLDDSYIHLALARTLIRHHVWGIDGSAFASASSSPGWTILLSLCDGIFGARLLNGLLANLVAGVGVLFAVDYGMRALVPAAGVGVRYVVLLVVLFGTPLPNLALLGMEHVAQTLATLLLVLFSVQAIAVERRSAIPRGIVFRLLLLAAAAGALRYEAVFVVVPVCLLLAARGRVGVAVLVGLCSAVGPVVFGAYFYHKSGLWLPFSVVVKAAEPRTAAANFFVEALHHTNGARFRPMLILMAAVWLVRLRRLAWMRPSQVLLVLSFLVCLLHLVFAPVGWLMRYESYLFALAFFSLGVALAELPPLRTWGKEVVRSSPLLWAEIGLIVLLGARVAGDLVPRAVSGLELPVEASVDRYYEHIQMAKFVARDYDHDTVVVNDIGAIAYYSDAHLLDLIGLGSAGPAIATHAKHPYTASDVKDWAASEHASIAVVQSHWHAVADILPPSWIKVATWVVPRNVVFGDYDVGFYAVNPAEIPRLCASLMSFPLPLKDRIELSPVCKAQGAPKRL